MSLLSGPSPIIGQVGNFTNVKFLATTANLATLTAAGYLNQFKGLMANPVGQGDVLFVNYACTGNNPATGSFGIFIVSISNGTITLSEYTSATGVNATLPTIVNHIAVYSNTNGDITEDVATAVNAGNLQAGLSGVQGVLASFPATAATGSLQIEAVSNSGNTNVIISNASHAQATVYSIPDVGAATGQLVNITGAVTTNTIPKFSGTTGKIAAGYTPSNTALSTVAMTDGTVTSGALAMFQDTTGTLGGALVMNSGISGTFGGSGTFYTIPAVGITAAYIITAGFWGPTPNPSSVIDILAAVDSFQINCTADPGAGSRIQWIAVSGTTP
jgi:hypothetical protein